MCVMTLITCYAFSIHFNYVKIFVGGGVSVSIVARLPLWGTFKTRNNE